MRYFLLTIILSTLLYVGDSNCASLCGVCSSDGKNCLQCKRGYILDGTGVCNLQNKLGIITATIIWGLILVLSLVLIVSACIYRWNKMVKSLEKRVTTNAVISSKINDTVQYICQPSFQPQSQVISSIRPILIKPNLERIKNINPNYQPTSITFKLQTPFPKNNRLDTQQFISTTNSPDNCMVCLNQNANVLVFPCNHYFHFGCLANSLNKSTGCPKCKTIISQVKVQCNGCGCYDDSVSFCPPGCTNLNHQNCFLHLNKDRLRCKNCDKSRKQRLRLSIMKKSNVSFFSKTTAIPSVPALNMPSLQTIGGTSSNIASIQGFLSKSSLTPRPK